MATNYDSIHTGQEIDAAVDIVQANVSKGDASTPVYFNASGIAVAVEKDATPTEDSENLVESGGVYTELSAKVPKTDIDTNVNLGTSNTKVPSQGAVKSYVDAGLATKQDIVSAGDGIVKEGDALSIDNDNDFMTSGKFDNKVNHFDNTLPYGTSGDMVSWMDEARHSSFVGTQDGYGTDPKLFTTLGHPVVTEDGLVSGCDTSNFVKVANFQQVANKPFNFKARVKFDEISVYQSILFFYDTNGRAISFYQTPNGAFQVNYKESTSASMTYGVYSGTLQDYNKGFCDVYGTVTDTKFSVKIVNSQGVEYETYVDTTGLLSTGAVLVFLEYYPSKNAVIDLKQFSVEVDGTEVFSGNKTGIDTLKVDDFNRYNTGVVITDDGVASGFDLTNYLYKPINLSGAELIEIEGEYTWNGQTETDNIPLIVGMWGDLSSEYDRVTLFATPLGKIQCNAKVNNVILTGIGNTTILPNVPLYHKIRIDSEGIRLYSTQNGLIINKGTLIEGTSSVLSAIAKSTAGLVIGGKFGGNLKGVIDLNATRVYVNGKLVYQPCLRIPYTLTKDGKKIVEYQHRHRVEDEYKQAGFTPYYMLNTIERANFANFGDVSIDTDWVASGFDANSYLERSTDFSITNELRIKTKVKYSTVANSSPYPQAKPFVSINFGNLRVMCDGGNTIKCAGSMITTTGTSVGTLQDNDIIETELILQGTSLTCNVKVNGVSKDPISTTMSSPISTLSDLVLGGLKTDYYFTGSIYLRDFQVYVDNKLVYNPIIPPNYTLATVKESAIVDSYDNGVNKWTKYADLTLKQQGSCTSGTAVQFAKSFRDDNYALSVPYTGTKSKTGFTPSFSSGTYDYIAIGKGYLTSSEE